MTKAEIKKLKEENEKLKIQLEEANKVLKLFRYRDDRFQSKCWEKLYEYFCKYF